MTIAYKYPSMDNYYKSVGDMLGDRVIATEKMDGANFSVHLKRKYNDDGEYIIERTYRSRNQKLTPGQPGMFNEAIQIAGGLDFFAPSLEAIYYFEVVGKGIQKRVDYTDYFKGSNFPSINDRTIFLLDVAFITVDVALITGSHTSWLSWNDVKREASEMGILAPSSILFYNLKMSDIEMLLSVKGLEGYVLRSETKDEPLFNHFGDLKRVKLKTNWFDSFEKKGPRNKKVKEKTPAEIVDFLLDKINFGRLHSVYSHGNSNLVYEMKDMVYLIDIVTEDIKAEDNTLWATYEHDVIRKTIARMLPKTLKGYLLERNSGDV